MDEAKDLWVIQLKNAKTGAAHLQAATPDFRLSTLAVGASVLTGVDDKDPYLTYINPRTEASTHNGEMSLEDFGLRDGDTLLFAGSPMAIDIFGRHSFCRCSTTVFSDDRLEDLLPLAHAVAGVKYGGKHRYQNARTGKSTEDGSLTAAELELREGDTLIIS